MRIVYFITRMDSIGGAQIHVRDMALAMRAEGHEVFVLSGQPGPFGPQLAAQGIELRSLSSLGRALSPWRDARVLLETVEVLRDLRPDIISLHSSKAGWLGRVSGRILGIPTVFTAHGWSFSGGLPCYRTLLYRWLEKIAGRWSERVVTVSVQDRLLAARHKLVPSERLTVIHNGMPDLAPHFLARPSAEPVRIVMVARFQEPKQHANLLFALDQLRDIPWTLEFVGDGPQMDEVGRLVDRLEFKERVIFAGVCSDVAERLSRAQIFVLLSAREGFPRSILEAMRAGLPVIASDVGGVREAVEEGTTGFLIANDDHPATVSRLRLLLADPWRREEMGLAARERFVQNFTFPGMFRKTMKIYDEVLSLRKKSPAVGLRR